MVPGVISRVGYTTPTITTPTPTAPTTATAAAVICSVASRSVDDLTLVHHTLQRAPAKQLVSRITNNNNNNMSDSPIINTS